MLRRAARAATRALILAALSITPLAAGAQQDIIRPVRLMQIADGGNSVTRTFFGLVVARQTVDLAFQVSGQIVEFPAAEGQEVAEGDLIAQLDLESFELQLQQAQLQYDQANRAVERLAQLTSSVSEVAREDAETELGLARVALRNAEYALENATLLAPFDGLVATRNVANFTTVSQGTPVVRFHDMSELRIEIDVPEVLFQRAGADADVTLEAIFPTGQQRYPLELREFNAEASSIGQTFRITLALQRPEGVIALPGSSVTVVVTLNTGEQRRIVPATAIRIANDGGTSVMRFVPEADDPNMGRLEEVEVEVGATREGAFAILSGLAPGDEIVSTGAHAVTDGEAVRRFTGFAD